MILVSGIATLAVVGGFSASNLCDGSEPVPLPSHKTSGGKSKMCERILLKLWMCFYRSYHEYVVRI